MPKLDPAKICNVLMLVRTLIVCFERDADEQIDQIVEEIEKLEDNLAKTEKRAG